MKNLLLVCVFSVINFISFSQNFRINEITKEDFKIFNDANQETCITLSSYEHPSILFYLCHELKTLQISSFSTNDTICIWMEFVVSFNFSDTLDFINVSNFRIVGKSVLKNGEKIDVSFSNNNDTVNFYKEQILNYFNFANLFFIRISPTTNYSVFYNWPIFIYPKQMQEE